MPEIAANHPEASLIHEAAIGNIAGEHLVKLMTLGLTEKEAEGLNYCHYRQHETHAGSRFIAYPADKKGVYNIIQTADQH